jgi:uncharacterized iron-regulated membrane protein
VKAVRKLLFWLHLSVGCVAGVVILAMSVTGALLAFERQIKAHIDAPAVLSDQADTSQRLSLDSVLTILKDNGQGIPSELILHNQATAPIEARYGRTGTLFLNPWTAEIIGQPSEGAEHFFATVEQIHRSLGLGMQSSFGRGITGAANLAFLFLLLSGAYLWLPRIFNLKNIKNRLLFRGGLSGRARERNWHDVIGAWTAVPLFFLVLTGVIMSYPWASNLLFKVTGTQPPAGGHRRGGPGQHRDQARNSESAAGPVYYRALDEAVLVGETNVPGWKSITIDLPNPGDKTIDISADTSAGGQPEHVTQLTVDRTSGALKTIKRFSDNNAGSNLRAWSRFLHTGEEFGLLGQTVAMLACVGGTVLVWTGISMAIRRAATSLSESSRERVPATSNLTRLRRYSTNDMPEV